MQTNVLPLGFETLPPSFDVAACGAMVDAVIDFANDFAAGILRAVAMKEIGDSLVAKESADAARMSPEARKTIHLGAVAVLRKYSTSMEYAAEITLGVGLVMWTAGNYNAIRKLREEGKAARLGAPPAASP